MSHKTKADRQREAKQRQLISDTMKQIDRNTEDLLQAIFREQPLEEDDYWLDQRMEDASWQSHLDQADTESGIR